MIPVERLSPLYRRLIIAAFAVLMIYSAFRREVRDLYHYLVAALALP